MSQYADAGTHMNTHHTNPAQPAASGLPVIPPAARITAFHAGTDVSTSDITQSEVLAHKMDARSMQIAGIVYPTTKGGARLLEKHIRSIESWLRHYASERRTFRKQQNTFVAGDLTVELRRLFAERRVMRVGLAALWSAVSTAT